MVKKWKITIPELTGDEKRYAYIYLPKSYRKNPTKRYPVLYMFDGHNVFFDSDATYGKSWGMKDYMDKSRTEMIIAAVECNHDPDNGRLKEYSPYDFEDKHLGYIEGKGELTMNWLVHTFKPYIDENFRTLPDRDHTFICGSSMGGLMTLYAILWYSDTFSRGAALSPSIWFERQVLTSMIQDAQVHPDTHLYLDYGQLEMGRRSGMRRHFGRVTSMLMQKGIFVTSRIIPLGTHCEANWERQIPLFMQTLLYEPVKF